MIIPRERLICRDDYGTEDEWIAAIREDSRQRFDAITPAGREAGLRAEQQRAEEDLHDWLNVLTATVQSVVDDHYHLAHERPRAERSRILDECADLVVDGMDDDLAPVLRAATTWVKSEIMAEWDGDES